MQQVQEALAVADAMTDPEAQRHMLFIAEAYRRLAQRRKERSLRLAALAEGKSTSGEDGPDGGGNPPRPTSRRGAEGRGAPGN
jgi:hypothetical protein